MFDKKGVFWFLGLTFGLTWLIDLAIYLRGGLAAPGAPFALALSMVMPAFSAILLGLLFFPQSPIFHKRPAGRGRWFYYFFLLYTVIIAIGVISMWLFPGDGMIEMVSIFIQLPLLVGLILIVVLRFAAGREAMDRVWLAGGRWGYWLLFGLAFVAFYVLQAALNTLFGLGKPELVTIPAPAGFDPTAYTLLRAAGELLIGSIVSTVICFGEEYGWRGYLQSELFKLGRVRGVLLLGAIWGVWHWPGILMGWNYPDHPMLGMLLMVFDCIASGVVYSYAVLKTGSVLLAAFLHAVNNMVVPMLFRGLGFMPFDRVFSFGIGIYGVAMVAVIAFFILRDPIWREKGSNLAQPAPVDIALSKYPGAVEKAADPLKLGTTL